MSKNCLLFSIAFLFALTAFGCSPKERAGLPCTSDQDCTGMSVCVDDICKEVECKQKSDCPASEDCVDHECVELNTCSSDADCEEPTPSCDPHSGQCVDCLPNCTGLCCGDDGCGGSCLDHCADTGQDCNADSCQCEGTCVPNCTGKECGPDSCDDVCGPGCADNEMCDVDGQCQCVPDCDGKECGNDGCGGECEPGCGVGENCGADGQCTACEKDCSGRTCGPDPVCGLSCGDCAADESCNLEGTCGPWCELGESRCSSPDGYGFEACGPDPDDTSTNTFGQRVPCPLNIPCDNASGRCQTENCLDSEITFLLDRSSSMLSGDTWDWVKSSFLTKVDERDSRNHFGFREFPSGGGCETGTVLSMLPDNYSAISNAIHDPATDSATPIEAALQGFTPMYGDPNDGQAVVLITDGDETCGSQDGAVAAAGALWRSGIQVHVIAVTTTANQAFLDRLAQAGGTEQSHLVRSGSELEDALETILRTVKSCRCEPEMTWCDGDDVQLCPSTGIFEQYQETCPMGCDWFTGSCVLCDVDDTYCQDGDLYGCRADGKDFEVLRSCPLGCDSQNIYCQLCADGETTCSGSDLSVCRADQLDFEFQETCPLSCDALGIFCELCPADETYCNQDGVYACSADRKDYVFAETCPMGCDAQDVFCLLCAVDESHCLDSEVTVCRADRKDFEFQETCALGCNAQADGCELCPADDTYCLNNETFICRADRKAYESLELCSLGCNDAGTRCKVACSQEGATLCQDNLLYICDSQSGAFEFAHQCIDSCSPDGQSCQTLCTRGQQYCTDGTIYLCNVAQQRFDSLTTCPGGCPASGPCLGAMVSIAGGSFVMGSDSGEGDSDEDPERVVDLHAYQIDMYPITTVEYAACVSAGKCTAPASSASASHADYYGNASYANYPVINLYWSQARDFCHWENKRLASEAEWERAARGPHPSERTYPWGETSPSCDLANYSSCGGDTSAVDAHPGGATDEGVYDLAGNVWEWVADWYDASAYVGAATINPLGPILGWERVIRGGGFSNSSSAIRTANRSRSLFYWLDDEIGFRCVQSATDSDHDGDGQSPASGDCNEAEPSVYTGQSEICNDDLDNNCNTLVDDSCPAIQSFANETDYSIADATEGAPGPWTESDINIDIDRPNHCAQLTLDINHPYIGDLEVEIGFPDASTQTLQDNTGGSSDDIQTTYLICTQLGNSTLGTWTLRIRDHNTSDEGSLLRWELTF